MAHATPSRRLRLELSVVRWARSMNTTTRLGHCSVLPRDTDKSAPCRCLFETSIIEAVRPRCSSRQELHPEPPFDGPRHSLRSAQRHWPHARLTFDEPRDDLL